MHCMRPLTQRAGEPRRGASIGCATRITRVLADLSDARPAVPGRLKSSLFGPYFRWTSVDGMINPFGLEVIANPDLLPFEKPFVAAHEWAHLAGYADESEASFVGFLTCIRAATPAAYSGWLFLYWEINSEVGASDRRQLASALEDGPRRDSPRSVSASVAGRCRCCEMRVGASMTSTSKPIGLKKACAATASSSLCSRARGLKMAGHQSEVAR